MNILHVTPWYFPSSYWGGPIFSVHGLNNALAKSHDITLTILTTDSAGPQVSDRSVLPAHPKYYPNQTVIFTRRIAMTSISLGLFFSLPRLVYTADLVHLTSTYSFPTIPTIFLCKILGKPLVWSPRGAIQDAHEWSGSRRKRLKRLWELVCNVILPNGRAVTHTTAERERVATQIRLPKAHAVVIPNGCNVPLYLKPKTWLPNGNIRLMYLGRLSEKKGLENLLDAIALLKDSQITLTIYGTGEAKYILALNSLAEKLDLLGKSVFFRGHIDGLDKGLAFQNADICIIPSYSENFCMVVAEALAHGIPVIASRGTPWAEIEQRVCGLWVENSPASLVDAIRRMQHMPLAEMGLRGRNWIIQDYSWNGVAKQMFDLYKSLEK